jgi:hypothetical protein
MSEKLAAEVFGLSPEGGKYVKVVIDVFRGDKVIHHQYSRELFVDKTSTIKDIEAQLGLEYIGECGDKKISFLCRDSKKKIKKSATMKKERRSKKIELPPADLGDVPKPEEPKKKDGGEGEDNIIPKELGTYY